MHAHQHTNTPTHTHTHTHIKWHSAKENLEVDLQVLPEPQQVAQPQEDWKRMKQQSNFHSV